MAACGQPGPSGRASATPPAAPAATSQGGEWLTYHGDAGRTGAALAAAGRFQSAAAAPAGASLDGDVYASPLVAGGLVIVATENDTVYAFDVASGRQRWSRHLGQPVDASSLPCGGIRPVSGITSTPVVDPVAHLVYVVAFVRPAKHLLFALTLDTGNAGPGRAVDPPGESPQTAQQRGALALGNGMVYVPYGGLLGDCGVYHGWVVGVPTGGGSPIGYRVPCNRECGLWAPGGPTIDGSGDLWVASGNADGFTTFDYGNSVLRLSPDLHLLDWFAPSDWAALSRADRDLGSISPVLLDGGLVWSSGKGGTGYLLRRDALGHIGGQAYAGRVCPTYGGSAYAAGTLYLACSGDLVAVAIDASTPSFTVRWRRPYASPGAPILAYGVLWAIDTGSGTLQALDTGDGHPLFSYAGGAAAHFVTPAAAGGRVYAALGRKLVTVDVRTSS